MLSLKLSVSKTFNLEYFRLSNTFDLIMKSPALSRHYIVPITLLTSFVFGVALSAILSNFKGVIIVNLNTEGCQIKIDGRPQVDCEHNLKVPDSTKDEGSTVGVNVSSVTATSEKV